MVKSKFGIWVTILGSSFTDILAKSGFDFVVLDMEHATFDAPNILNVISVFEKDGVDVYVRVSHIDKAQMLRSLDLGVKGIFVPNILELSETYEVIQGCYFPPLGARGYSPFTRAGGYGDARKNPHYFLEKNSSTEVCIHVENTQVVSEIMETNELPDGVTHYFIGLYDLSKSMGFPGDVKNPALLKLVATVTEKLIASGVKVGTIVFDRESCQSFKKMGMSFFLVGVDAFWVKQSFSEILPTLE